MTHVRAHVMAAFAAAGILMTVPFITAPALAQASGCQDGQKIISERQSLAQQLNKLGGSGAKKKQIDPRAACPLFTKLVANGEAGMKWMTNNKDWCQIPDQVLANFNEEHKRIQTIKGQACTAAQKINEMEKKAKQAQQQQKQNGNPFGGGLQGTYTIPKGAL